MAINVFKSSAVMAAGTMLSRLLGFLRAFILIKAIGVNPPPAAAFDLANKAPNLMYMLIVGGVLNAVLVPQIVSATKRSDGGTDFINRLLTLALTVITVVTVVLTLCTPLVIGLYASSNTTEATLGLAIMFGYLCLPQMFFYGLYTLIGQVLNAKGSFGPYMWAPLANNILAITGLLIFIKIYGFVDENNPGISAENWTTDMVWLLAGSATISVAAQALVLLPFLRRIKFRYRPTWGFRGVGLGTAGKVATWTFAGVAVGQLVFITTSRVTNDALSRAEIQGGVELANATPSNTAYTVAFLLFMLPHSIVVVSLVTALFTRISKAVADDRLHDVGVDFSMALRVIGLVATLATAGLVVLHQPIGAIMSQRPQDAQAIGLVLTTMALGLVPFSSNYLVQRVFYAMENGKAPFIAQLPNFAVILITNTIVYYFVPLQYMVAGVGLGMSLGNACGLVTAWWMVHRKLPDSRTPEILKSWLKLVPAAAISCGLGYLAFHIPVEAEAYSKTAAWIRFGTVGPIMVASYLAVLYLLRAPELRYVQKVLLRRR